MKFTVLTLFPDMIRPFVEQSILGRAQQAGAITVSLRNLRDWATDKHHTVDDAPYGGGAGMVLKVDVIDRALAELRTPTTTVVLLTPTGRRFTQATARTFAEGNRDLLLLAGHYEGFDERVRSLVDEEISIGDFVLTGGELPAVMLLDAVARLLPNVLGNPASSHEESFSDTHPLEYPHYTRPDSYTPASRDVGTLVVPEILTSGNHAAIEAWRAEQSTRRANEAATRDSEPQA